ncbi:hypothetical protein QBC39DRAFT_174778 [Podospora conica]|nr:hypothetical protein QBC39DRAFT_174778 [Schizothecium conicum]
MLAGSSISHLSWPLVELRNRAPRMESEDDRTGGREGDFFPEPGAFGGAHLRRRNCFSATLCSSNHYRERLTDAQPWLRALACPLVHWAPRRSSSHLRHVMADRGCANAGNAEPLFCRRHRQNRQGGCLGNFGIPIRLPVLPWEAPGRAIPQRHGRVCDLSRPSPVMSARIPRKARAQADDLNGSAFAALSSLLLSGLTVAFRSMER